MQNKKKGIQKNKKSEKKGNQHKKKSHNKDKFSKNCNFLFEDRTC